MFFIAQIFRIFFYTNFFFGVCAKAVRWLTDMCMFRIRKVWFLQCRPCLMVNITAHLPGRPTAHTIRLNMRSLDHELFIIRSNFQILVRFSGDRHATISGRSWRRIMQWMNLVFFAVAKVVIFRVCKVEVWF